MKPKKQLTKDKQLIEQETFWVGMPDFKQDKQTPYAKIIFRFENEEDLQQFAEIIGQKLTSKTKSSWHPFKPHRRKTKEVWTSK